MNSFVQKVNTDQVVGKTFNGAVSWNTTNSTVLNFFKAIGQRGADLSKEFEQALNEDSKLAVRALLWSRDIRGGAGEREVFRKVFKSLQNGHLELVIRLIPHVAKYGRWDDLLVLSDPLARAAVFGEVKKALLEDKNGLCAKWMPRKGKVAAELRSFLGLTPKGYRKLLVNLTKVVETQMCAREWDAIVYDHVPSVAAARYQKTFYKHSPEAYKAYREGLTKVDPETGKTERKINASTLFPYDVIKSFWKGDKEVADATWEVLPDLLGDNSIVPIVDTSGSMGSWSYYGQRGAVKSSVSPLEVAVSLGLYVASKQKGAFRGMWMNFSTNPKLFQFIGPLSLSNMFAQMERNFHDWDGSTNVDAAFDRILEVAVNGNIPQEEMPKMLVILSDMEFDQSVGSGYGRPKVTNFDRAKQRFASAGYKLPQVVFWNINGRAYNNPVQMHETGTALVSGFSPAVFKSVLSNNLENYTPYNVMLDTLKNDRYDIEDLTV